MKLRDLDLRDHPVNAEHQAWGLPPVEAHVSAAAEASALLDRRVLVSSVIALISLFNLISAPR